MIMIRKCSEASFFSGFGSGLSNGIFFNTFLPVFFGLSWFLFEYRIWRYKIIIHLKNGSIVPDTNPEPEPPKVSDRRLQVQNKQMFKRKKTTYCAYRPSVLKTTLYLVLNTHLFKSLSL